MSLQKYHFKIINIDPLVMIYKNWLDDAKIGCLFATSSLKNFYFVEMELLDEHEELGEVGYFRSKQFVNLRL